MFSQQRKAQVMALEIIEKPELPYKYDFKQVIIPKSFQLNLGVTTGDTVIIRENMLSRTAACIISGKAPESDEGSEVIRLSNETRKRYQIKLGSSVLIESIETISAEEISIEWYLRNLAKKHLKKSTIFKITQFLVKELYNELHDLPLVIDDRFQLSFSLPDLPEHNYNITYWIRSIRPRFPVMKLSHDTDIHIF